MTTSTNTPFDRNKSSLRLVYEKFSCKDPGELRDLYQEEDQRLMYKAAWDHRNDELLTNQIKDAIEKAGGRNIGDAKEQRWISNILWLWYHHAISSALWRYGDKEEAQKFSAEALSVQPSDHPNKITRLLYYLTRDDLEKAEEWAETITTEPEKTTAHYDLDLYRKGDFFKVQK